MIAPGTKVEVDLRGLFVPYLTGFLRGTVIYEEQELVSNHTVAYFVELDVPESYRPAWSAHKLMTRKVHGLYLETITKRWINPEFVRALSVLELLAVAAYEGALETYGA